MSRKKQPTAEERHRQLEADVERFLSCGGCIQKVEIGRSGENKWNPEHRHNPCTQVKLPNQIAYGFTVY